MGRVGFGLSCPVPIRHTYVPVFSISCEDSLSSKYKTMAPTELLRLCLKHFCCQREFQSKDRKK